jgi:hypothetical protein
VKKTICFVFLVYWAGKIGKLINLSYEIVVLRNSPWCGSSNHFLQVCSSPVIHGHGSTFRGLGILNLRGAGGGCQKSSSCINCWGPGGGVGGAPPTTTLWPCMSPVVVAAGVGHVFILGHMCTFLHFHGTVCNFFPKTTVHLKQTNKRDNILSFRPVDYYLKLLLLLNY